MTDGFLTLVPTRRRGSILTMSSPEVGTALSRRQFLTKAAISIAFVGFAEEPATAIVKGNAPPSGYNRGRGNGVVESGPATESPSGEPTFAVTKTGVRYKDMKMGSGDEVKPRSEIDMRYRVMKLGKRSYDGISGEATTVFSLGYGEDDDKEGSVLQVPVGVGRLVSAVDEAVVGMHVGGVRRVAVRPEQGWKKNDPKCATEIDMGALSGVPGAALAKVEDCIDTRLEPRPVGYGATRRMSRRFDETLIVEVEVVALREGISW
ncbi:unnamed protein product [Discosporangium mesarthrocarpum]